MDRDQPIALLDMDGTLADFDGAMQRDMAKLAAPGEPTDCWRDESIPYIKARQDMIKRQPGWWLKLDRHPAGFEIMYMLRDLGFQLMILTRDPHKNAEAWREKFEWIRLHLQETLITMTEDKGLVYGKILVDDWPPYIEAWLRHRPRGMVVMPAHPWNEQFHHPQVLRYTASHELPALREIIKNRFLKGE
ncbi:MAG: 5' nucleotidase, NT5C type [Acidiferrobacterales bacterium]